MTSTSDPKKCVSNFLARNCTGIEHHFDSMLGQAVGGVCTRHPNQPNGCQDASRTDVFCSGFPCQPYSKKSCKSSTASPRDHDLYAVDEVELVIQRRSPRVVLLENVLGIRRQFHDSDKTELETICAILVKHGYSVRVTTLSGHAWHEGFRGQRISTWLKVM